MGRLMRMGVKPRRRPGDGSQAPRLPMERFGEHCGRSRTLGKIMSFCHLGLASPGPYGAARRAVQDPEAA